MPIVFDLEILRQHHGCVNYFETGLWDPIDDVSFKKALSCGFDKLFSVEIQKEWVEIGNELFKTAILSGRCELYCDDSTNMKKYLSNDCFKNKTIFFLDAHIDNKNIHNYKKKCPLFYELEAINSLERKDNLILIDDLRIIKNGFPWGEESYGDINFLQQIMNYILTINKDYKFATLDGCINDDVLIAFI
jgi:hypothetical protein